MRVWVVFTEREWDWQTHKNVHSVHATEKSADDLCAELGRDCSVDEFDLVGSPASGDCVK
jgi:hypothetical protein